MTCRGALVIAAVALLAFWPSHASAEAGRQSDFTLRLTTVDPGSPTGMELHVLFRKPGDPDGKPQPLRTAVVTLPSGFAFDSGALPECQASDDEIRVLGSNACPSETALAVGTFSAMIGLGPPFDPVSGENHVFNGPNQLIEIITAPGLPLSPGFDRLTFDGSTVTAHPPKAPGAPPDGEASIRSIGFDIPARTAGPRSLFTAPPDCPASGSWTSTATFGFADGSSDTVASASPCR